MVICNIKRYFFLILLLFCLPVSSNTEIKSTKISPIDLILIKYELFFLKHKNRLLTSGFVKPMIHYESLDYTVQIDKDENIKINVYAFMNKKRYKVKKYIPKLYDCNVIRNKLVTNKYGYSAITLKRNYSVSKEILYKIIKKNIYSFYNLSEKVIKNSIDKTTIYIDIFHPIQSYNFSCSGKLTQEELN